MRSESNARRVRCGCQWMLYLLGEEGSGTSHSVCTLLAPSPRGTPPLLDRTTTEEGTQRTVTFQDTCAMVNFGVNGSGYHERDTAYGLFDSTGC